MNVSRIGIVPRTPVIDLEGFALPFEQQIAQLGADFVQAPWPEGVTILDGFRSYAVEHVALKDKPPKRIRNDLKRMGQAAMEAFRIFGPQKELEALTRNDGRTFAQVRMSEGVCAASARRELSVISAAALHAKKEGRVAKLASLWKPEPAEPRVMFLTVEQYRGLMALDLDRRTCLFFRLAFETGARSEAIEEAQWSQIDWEARTIEYRHAGVKYKNKRRVCSALNAKLVETLREAYQTRDPADPYIIGRGKPRKNAVATTYHSCVRAMKKLGIYKKGLARHVARHSFATWLIQARVPIAEVAAMLGDNVSMVEKHYSHLMPKDLHRAASILASIH